MDIKVHKGHKLYFLCPFMFYVQESGPLCKLMISFIQKKIFVKTQIINK